MSVTRRQSLFVLGAVLLLVAAAWLVLRQNLDGRMAIAAQRGLDTIADLVADDLRHAGARLPGLRGGALLARTLGADHTLAGTLTRAGGEHFRRVYFFDAAGTAYRVDDPARGTLRASAATGGIVAHALHAPPATRPIRGVLFAPYAGLDGEAAVGVWQWLPDLGLGVVAERPYERYAYALLWVDATFAILLAGVLLGGLLHLRQIRRAAQPQGGAGLTRCGPYAILRQIGEGAMSNVYLARHRLLHRTVALKRLKTHAESDELAARFNREVRLASRLAHPNIVTILDYGRAPGGGFYYTMEYIRGLSLGQWIERHGPLAPDRAVRLLRQLCAALAAMHAHQLLHRDIKPDNVMAYAAHDDYDLLKLLDFGLIKDLEPGASRDLTRDVRILGTPAFMAPERLLDPRRADPRTDLYGVGCIGYHLLTGRRPFEADREADLVQQVLHIAAPSVASRSPFPIPEPLDRLIAAALAKDMAQRPASAADLAARLDDLAVLVPWQREAAARWWRDLYPDPAAAGSGGDPGGHRAART
jgi:serine/threonine-protein kinase